MMHDDRMMRSHRRRLTTLLRRDGVMTWGQRLRLLHWHRQQRNEALRVTVGPQPAPVWCIVANVADERGAGPGGQQRWRGTKHFTPGTKVYVLKPLWDWSLHRFMVLGRARRTHR